MSEFVSTVVAFESSDPDALISLLQSKFTVEKYSKTSSFDGHDALVVVSMLISSAAGVVAIFSFFKNNGGGKSTDVTKFRIRKSNSEVEIDYEGTDLETLVKLIEKN